MTSIPVMEKSGNQVKSFMTKGQKSAVSGFADSFSGAINQNKELNVSRKQQKIEQQQADSPKTATVVQDNKANERFEKVNASAENSMQNKSKVSEQQEVAGNEIVKDVIKELADELDVTEEELLSAMESLGLSLNDLTNISNMAKLAANLMENIDSIALVTDEGLFEKISILSTRVDEAIEELETQFQLKPEQIEEIFTKVLEGNHQSEQTLEQTDDVTTFFTENSKTNDAKEVLATMEEQVEPEEDLNQNKKLTGKVSETESETQKTTLKVEVEQAGSRETKNEANHNFQNSFAQNAEVFANKILTENMKQEVSLPTVDPQSILEQIGEYVKISSKDTLSEMEMQLHPESLGNLHLNVSVKEGVVTAHFTAQNEAVKQALETQVVQLKERLEGQGIKVEAIEVTIASHEFERNLHNQNKEKNTEAVKKTGRRKINLNELSDQEDSPNESEADKIQKDIMVKNGNTVDYMA